MKNLVTFSSKRTKTALLYSVGAVLLCLSAALSFALGSVRLSFADVIDAARYGADYSVGTRVFVFVRLPRTLAAVCCGAALSVSGAVIQGVLANRLASPSVIGVNSGAGLAVTLCTAFGILGGWRLSLCSFLGAFIVVLLVSLGAKRWGASRGTVILIGVAMNSLLGAISDTVTTLIPEVGVMSNDFKIGTFSAVTYNKLVPSLITVAITLLIVYTLSTQLDVLNLGEETAKGLGLNTSLMRVIFLILSAILAGCAVSLAGLLSFVGLLVPHAVRRAAGNKSSHLLQCLQADN